MNSMQIIDAAIRPCTQRLRDSTWKFARATVPQLEGHLLVLTDELGNRGLGYVHAIPAAHSQRMPSMRAGAVGGAGIAPEWRTRIRLHPSPDRRPHCHRAPYRPSGDRWRSAAIGGV